MDAPTALLDPMAAGLAAVLDAGDRLTRALAMTELELPAGLDRLVGEARGAPLELTTRAWTGAPLERLVIASIRVGGALRSATLIGLPRAASRVPILGVDLIALGGGLSLAAIDLAAIDDAAWEAGARPLLDACHAAIAGQVVARRWPSFAAEVFSPRAVIVGARPGHEHAVLAAAAALVDGYAALAAAADGGARPEAEAAARRRRLAWQAAERRNRREHDALSRLFGGEPAARYLTYLFGQDEEDADA